MISNQRLADLQSDALMLNRFIRTLSAPRATNLRVDIDLTN